MKYLALLLSALLLSSCAGVEYHHMRINKDAWVVSKYLEAGKEPPTELILQAKVIPVVLWLAIVEGVFKFLPDFLKYQGSMYHETDISLLWWHPRVAKTPAVKQNEMPAPLKT